MMAVEWQGARRSMRVWLTMPLKPCVRWQPEAVRQVDQVTSAGARPGSGTAGASVWSESGIRVRVVCEWYENV